MLSLEKEKKYNIIERTYIDSKVSHVCWKPENHHQVPNFFLSGSYEEDENHLELWKYPHSYWTQMVEDPGYQNFVEEMYPSSVYKHPVQGDVTGLKFVSSDKFIFCTNYGDFSLMNLNHDEKKLGKFDLVCNLSNDYVSKDEKCSYMGFDACETFICALNESGHIFLISNDCAKCFAAVTFYEDRASCVSILNEKEILVGNLRGQLNLWDTRDMFQPTKIFPQNVQQTVGVTCISVFPVQKHILVTAGLDGSIVTWDLRKAYVPLTVYEAHDRPVTCLKFHESWPTNLFTASMGGEVWHWKNFGDLITNKSDSNFFDRAKKKNPSTPEVEALVGSKSFLTNSLDVIKDQLVSSTDNDTFVFVRPLNLG